MKFVNLLLLALLIFLIWPAVTTEKGKLRALVNRIVTAVIVAFLATWTVRFLWQLVSN